MRFVVNDHALHQAHKAECDRFGRWLLTIAVLAGWAIGSVTALQTLMVPIPQAFLAGAPLLNVLKEELPAEQQARMWAFMLGACGYALLLLALG